MQSKKLIVVILCFLLMLGITGFLLSPGNSGDITLAAAQDGTGSGTSDQDPYLIGTAATLNGSTARTMFGTANRYIKLIDNINIADVTTNWTPIPALAADTVFDGDGFTIDNLKITATTGNQGFFANLLGTVKNVSFSNVSIGGSVTSEAMQNFGVVAGTVYNNGSAYNVTLQHVYVISGIVNGGTYYGGLVGTVQGAAAAGNASTCVLTVTNCYSTASVQSKIKKANYAGGFFGRALNCTLIVKNNFVSGDVIDGDANTTSRVGGLVADCTGVILTITNFYCSSQVLWKGSGQGCTGGIIGQFSGTSATLKNVIFRGNLTGGGSAVISAILPSSATGTISLTECYYTATSSLAMSNYPNSATNSPGSTNDGLVAETDIEEYIEIIMIMFYGYNVWRIAPPAPLPTDGYAFYATRLRYAYADMPYSFSITLAASHNQTAPTVKINNVLWSLYESPDTQAGVTAQQNGNVYTYTVESLEENIAITVTPVLNTYTITAGPAFGVDPDIFSLSGISQTQNVQHGTVMNFTITVDTAYSAYEPFVKAGNNTLSSSGGSGPTYDFNYTATENCAITIDMIVAGGYRITRPASGTGWVSQSNDPNAVLAGGNYIFTVNAAENYYGYSGAWRAPVVTIMWAGNPTPQTLLPIQGSDQTTGVYVYEITNIQADVTINISNMTLNTYPVTLPASGAGFTASAGQAGTVFSHGATYNFTVQLDAGYLGNEPLVRAAGVTLSYLFTSNPALGTFNYSFTVTGPTTISISTSNSIFTVDFYLNDGTASKHTTQSVSDGDIAFMPASPQRPGYTFAGWYTLDGTGGNWGSQWNFSASIMANMDLYAKWNINPVFSPTTLPNGIYDTAYSESVSATCADAGTIVYTLQSGRLPPGLSFSGDTISGTPTVANLFTFIIRATNVATGAFFDQQFTITIDKAGPPPNPGPLVAAPGSKLGDIGLPNGWTWDDTSSTSVGGAGTKMFTASFIGSTYYSAVQNVEITIEVGKANPPTPGPFTITYAPGLTLSNSGIYLGEGWTWDNSMTVLSAGIGATFLANFAGDSDYNSANRVIITVNINKANNPPNPGPMFAVFGDTLADVALPYGWIWDSVSSTSVGGAGTKTFTASFSGDANYNATPNVNITIKVGKANPPAPGPFTITYAPDLTLGNSGIDLGTGWTWDNSATALSAGWGQTFLANFEGTANYNSAAEVIVTVNIERANNPPNPGPLVAALLDTLGDVGLPNGWTWDDQSSTPVGSAGTQVFTASFEGDTNYYPVNYVNVTINVGKINPPSPGPFTITYSAGLTLFNSGINLGDGWTWDNSATALNAGLGQTFLANFEGDETYNAETDVVVIVNINKADNPPNPGPVFAALLDTLSAVGLPNGWTWDLPGTTSVGGAGTKTFTASFAGDTNYNAAQNVVITLNVGRVNPPTPGPFNVTYIPGLTLANSGINLGIGWTWDSPTTPLNAGIGETFLANFAGDSNYNSASEVVIVVNVNKANPPIPGPLVAALGDTLAAVGLPNGWTWDLPETTSVGSAGTKTFTASFAGDTNYNAVNYVYITMNVDKINPPVPGSFNITYSTGLTLGNSGIDLGTGWTWANPGTSLFAGSGQTFSANFAGNSNYNSVSGVIITVNVNKAQGSGSVYLENWEYNGTPNDPTTTNTTNPAPAYEYKVAGTSDLTYALFDVATSNYPTAVGNYVLRATFPDGVNHLGFVVTINFSIGLTEGSGSTSVLDWTYGGAPSTPSVSSSTNPSWTIKYVGIEPTNYTETTTVPTKAGEYTMTVYFDGNASYGAFEISCDFKINKANPVTPAPSAVTYTPTLTLADIVLPAGWTWNTPLTTISVLDNNKTFLASYVDTTGNYNDKANVVVTILVNKATPTTPTGLTAVYGETLANVVGLSSDWTWTVTGTTSVGGAGNQTFYVNYIGDTTNYTAPTNVEITVIVNKATPTTPTGLTAVYGQTLANVVGLNTSDWQWTVSSGTSVGNVGNNTFYVNYIGSTTNHTAPTNVDVTVEVLKAYPTFTQSGTYSYTYGETLDSQSLSGESANVAGSFAFKNPSSKPDAGTANVKVVFTPNDTTNYNTIEFDLTISIAKADPMFTQVGTYSYTYGETLDSRSLSGESANVEGSFAFKNPSNVPSFGTTTAVVVFTPTDTINYNIVEFNLTISVCKTNPTFTQSGTYSYTYGETLDSQSLSGESASVEGSFAFKNPNSTPDAGTTTVVVVFTPTDTTNYNIVEFDLTISIAKADPMFTQSGTYSYTYGETLDSQSLSGESASVAGSFAFKFPSSKPDAGTTSVKVVFTPNDTTNYNTVEFDLAISIAKADPTFTQSGTYSYTYGETLDSQSPSGESANVAGSFAFKFPSSTPDAGTTSVKVVFTPTDTTNYNIVEFDLAISIAKADKTNRDNALTVDNWTYGETGGPSVGNIAEGATVTYYYSKTADFESKTTTKPTDAGTYYVYAVIEGSENYNELTTAVAQFTIAKAAFDMSGVKFEDKAFKYNGNIHNLIISGLPDGVEVSEYINNGKTEKGTYIVTVKFKSNNPNYDVPSDMTAKLVINDTGLLVDSGDGLLFWWILAVITLGFTAFFLSLILFKRKRDREDLEAELNQYFKKEQSAPAPVNDISKDKAIETSKKQVDENNLQDKK